MASKESVDKTLYTSYALDDQDRILAHIDTIGLEAGGSAFYVSTVKDRLSEAKINQLKSLGAAATNVLVEGCTTIIIPIEALENIIIETDDSLPINGIMIGEAIAEMITETDLDS